MTSAVLPLSDRMKNDDNGRKIINERDVRIEMREEISVVQVQFCPSATDCHNQIWDDTIIEGLKQLQRH